MDSAFALALVLLGTAAVTTALAARLGLPTVLGYLAAGVVLGPSATGIVQPGAAMGFLAELGVVLLMFMIGLEFSVSEFLATRRQVLVAGGLQVLLTATAAALIARVLGADWPGAVLIGGAVTMSSTAIAAKQLAEQGELTSRHGHLAVKVLVFQDLAAIPLLALLAAWSRGGSPAWTALLGESLWTLAVFAAAALLGKPVLYRALAWVARNGSAELFLLAALLLVVAAGFGAHLLGLSPALGAFLAGLALGESDFRHRVEDDIRPFRDLLLGVFFTTVALQFDLTQLVRAPHAVFGWLLVLVPLKMALAWPAARAAGLAHADALRAGVILGHGGEFGLLLAAGALGAGILTPELGLPLLVALPLSMSLAPLLIGRHDRLTRLLMRRGAQLSAPQQEELDIARDTAAMHGHVLVCGAGNLGRLAARALTLADVPHVLIESDFEAFTQARREGLRVLYGDASRIATLHAAGVERAALVLITFHRLTAAARIARALRHSYPNVPVLATSLTEHDARALQAIAGLRVYPEKIAAGLALAEQALLATGYSAEAADRLIARLRSVLRQEDERDAARSAA